MATERCLFCNPSKDRLVVSNELAFGAWDSYPISAGHMLLMPFRHIPEYFDATQEEKAALWQLVDDAQALIQERHRPDGFNVVVNIGRAAGQSVFHLHIHVIPRYSGDVPNPKGGIRGVIPEKRLY